MGGGIDVVVVAIVVTIVNANYFTILILLLFLYFTFLSFLFSFFLLPSLILLDSLRYYYSILLLDTWSCVKIYISLSLLIIIGA